MPSTMPNIDQPDEALAVWGELAELGVIYRYDAEYWADISPLCTEAVYTDIEWFRIGGAMQPWALKALVRATVRDPQYSWGAILACSMEVLFSVQDSPD